MEGGRERSVQRSEEEVISRMKGWNRTDGGWGMSQDICEAEG